jgi:preprotein translocase subunit SecY
VKFIETIKNIWSIKELRDKILFTLLLVLVYRIGSYVVLPGVDPSSLDALAAKAGDGILGMVNVFAGGAFSRASIMALGIMPYISASIAVQLLTIAVPYFQKLQKEGESGRRQINQITRILTIIVTMVQGAGYLTLVNSQQ